MIRNAAPLLLLALVCSWASPCTSWAAKDVEVHIDESALDQVASAFNIGGESGKTLWQVYDVHLNIVGAQLRLTGTLVAFVPQGLQTADAAPAPARYAYRKRFDTLVKVEVQDDRIIANPRENLLLVTDVNKRVVFAMRLRDYFRPTLVLFSPEQLAVNGLRAELSGLTATVTTSGLKLAFNVNFKE